MRDAWTAKRLQACRKKPTEPEKRLTRILAELSLSYTYVGNGKLVINGKNPDWANANGQKKLIELFGCYWHCCEMCGKREWEREEMRERDGHRLEGYASLGFETLVIWEHELSDVGTVKQRLLEFEKEKLAKLSYFKE